MAITIIIVALIAVYSFLVIRKRVKEIKRGKFCSCGCQDCPSKCSEFMKKE